MLPVIIALFGLVAVHGLRLADATDAKIGLPLPDYLFGLSGILLAHVFNMPLATRWLVQALEQIPANHWRQAAQLDMPEWSRFCWLEWPAMRRLLPGLASLIFMLCFTSFTIVMALGGGPQATTLKSPFIRHCALILIWLLPATGMLAAIGGHTLVVLSYGWLNRRPRVCHRHINRYAIISAMRCYWIVWFLVWFRSVPAPFAAIVWYGLQVLFDLAWQQSMLCTPPCNHYKLRCRHISAGFEHRFVIELPSSRCASSVATLGRLLCGHRFVDFTDPHLGAQYWSVYFAARKVDRLPHGFWLVMLLNALAALPYTLRVLQEPMADILLRYDRLADSLGLTGFSRLRWLEWHYCCADWRATHWLWE